MDLNIRQLKFLINTQGKFICLCTIIKNLKNIQTKVQKQPKMQQEKIIQNMHLPQLQLEDFIYIKNNIRNQFKHQLNVQKLLKKELAKKYQVGEALFYLGKAYRALGKYKQAQQCLNESLQNRKKNFGEKDSDYLETLKQKEQLDKQIKKNQSQQWGIMQKKIRSIKNFQPMSKMSTKNDIQKIYSIIFHILLIKHYINLQFLASLAFQLILQIIIKKMNSSDWLNEVIQIGEAAISFVQDSSSLTFAQISANNDQTITHQQILSSYQFSQYNETRLMQKPKMSQQSSSFGQFGSVIIIPNKKQNNNNNDNNIKYSNKSFLSNGQKIQIKVLQELQSSQNSLKNKSQQQNRLVVISNLSGLSSSENDQNSNSSNNQLSLEIRNLNQTRVYSVSAVRFRDQNLSLEAVLQKSWEQGNNSSQNFDPNLQIKQLPLKQRRKYELNDQINTLKLQKFMFGQTNLQYADTLGKVGELYKKSGDFKKSLKYFDQQLQIVQLNQGRCNQKYIKALFNISQVQYSQGNYKLGHQMSEKIKNQAKQVLGQQNVLFLNILHFNGLTNAYFEGDLQAIRILERSIQIAKEISNQQQVRSILEVIKIDLAYSYSATKNNFYALKITDQIKNSRKQSRIIDINKNALIQSLYGTIYKRLKDYNKSLGHFFQHLRFSKQANGDNHQLVSIPLKHIGQIYLIQKDFHKAKMYIEWSLKISEKAIGKDSPKYALTLIIYGQYFYEIQNYQKALQVLEQCVLILRKGMSSKKFQVGMALFQLGRVYKKTNQFQKAYQTLVECLQNRRINFTQQSQQYKQTLEQLIQVKQFLKFNDARQN